MAIQAKPQTLNVLNVADDPRLSRGTEAFLEELNSAGVALETLTPLEARQVLVNAHRSGFSFDSLWRGDCTLRAIAIGLSISIENGSYQSSPRFHP
jgi:hypothetical protein